MTPMTAITVGRRPGAHAVGLRTIAAPWVEFQALEISPEFRDDFRIVNRSMGSSPGDNQDPVRWAGMLLTVLETYKDHCAVFRYVANAILNAHNIHETRPVQEYHSGQARSGRIPAIRAITESLASHFDVIGSDDVAFRSPLELLAWVVYGAGDFARAAAPDELAVLFSVLVQAVGIPSWLVVNPRSARLTVECETGLPGRSSNSPIAVFDPYRLSVDFVARKPTGRDRLELHTSDQAASGGVRAVSGFNVVAGTTGRYPEALRGLVGTGRNDRSQFWRTPLRAPAWYGELDQAWRSFNTADHDPFLSRVTHRMHRTTVAENRGPPVTGAIIAYMVYLYSTRFARLFRRITELELDKRERNWRSYSPLALADAIARLVRDRFAYREEMWRVEEILSPITQWRFDAFRPGEQCHDCDDLGVNTMTLWESFDIPSGIRLAGDAGKDTQYHVYPFVVKGGKAYVFDVSAPDIYREMEHGENYIDYLPRVENTYARAFGKSGVVDPVRLVAGCDCLRIIGSRSQL